VTGRRYVSASEVERRTRKLGLDLAILSGQQVSGGYRLDRDHRILVINRFLLFFNFK